jgi:chromosome segregation ATPase
VIESILFFVLGFLCAGFLALMVAPAIWRRAVVLTRRRIEASVPLSVNEIQADKDRMRAEFAMSTRRLEMSIKSFKEKAASQIVEINRNREELRLLAEERADKNETLTALEASASELRAELRRREEQLQQLSYKLIDAEKLLEERALELEKLGRMYDEASFSSSSRQIELVARETEVEKLSGDVSSLRDQRKNAEQRVREAEAENKALQDELKLERRKAAEMEKRLERLMANLSDREEKLDRREKEMERLREQVKLESSSENEISAALAEAQEQKVRLEAEVADLTLQMSTLLSGATGADIEKAMEKLTADRQRLEERLTTLMRENKKLRGDLETLERSKSDEWDEERRENALLREQINDLAAEVVNLTMMLDGPESPIRRALAQPANGQVSGLPHADAIVSLADRVRALQKAAAANNAVPSPSH